MDLEEISLLIDIAEEKMDGAIDHLQNELTKLRTGKASTDILKGIMVPYYGAPTPIQQIANISTGDARTQLLPVELMKLTSGSKATSFDKMANSTSPLIFSCNLPIKKQI